MIILPKIQESDLQKQLENILRQKFHKEQVVFALNCAKDVQHLHDSEQANVCIELVEQWLNDPSSVTNEQLRNARSGNSAFSFDLYAADACFAAGNAVRGDYFSWAAWSGYYAAQATKEYDYQMKFYITELTIQLTPHETKIPPVFNLNNQQEFTISLDFIQEFLHDDLLQQEKNQIYFKFYPYLRANKLTKLIDRIFNNKIYKSQVTRILTKLLES